MSGAAREGWNIFSKWGRGVLWFNLRNPRRWKRIWYSREYLLKDSFGIFVCHAVGHSQQTFWAPQCSVESQICLRCFRPTGAFREQPGRGRALESLLRDANEKLRSAYQIAARQGRNTNWEAFSNRVHESLVRQHVILWPKELKEATEPPADGKAPSIDGEQIIEIDEDGKVHGDISGLKP